MKPHGVTPEMRRQFKDLYRRGWSLRRIGRELECAGTTVARWLRRDGVALRDRGIAVALARGRTARVDAQGYVRWGSRRIHRTICEAWHGPPPTPNHGVNHIDGDKLNNHPDNLEWVTPEQNTKHSWRVGLAVIARGVAKANAKLDPDKVREMRKMRNRTGKTYREIGDQFGVSANVARHAIKGDTWSHVT